MSTPFTTVPGVTLAEVNARFDELQARLVPLWKSIQAMSDDPQTILVVPSVTLAKSTTAVTPGRTSQALEERFLFLLLLLRQPSARVIFVTSLRIAPNIVDYYLDLLPGVIPSHARKRLFLISPQDPGAEPLTEKLLARPHLLEEIRSLIPDEHRAHLVPYNTTEYERDLAVRLGIPMYGADPKLFHHGTKSGCRELFEKVGVRHPVGRENLWDENNAVEAILSLRASAPDISEVLIKLNEGVSGSGNALIDLRGLPAPGEPDERDAVTDRLRAMECESDDMDYDLFMKNLGLRAGIVEERIVGDEFQSPSVQLRVTPLGEVQVLSTHDQMLGGPSGQAYLGCKFPADPGYAVLITEEAAKVGAQLAKEGMTGRFAIDFVTVRSGQSWNVYAIEINLRKGGTTHPYLTLQFLTDGSYDPENGIFRAPDGREKYFVASDHVESPSYRGLVPDDLFDIVVRHGLHFHQGRQTGVVFHMMSALSTNCRVGLTAVADSPAAADALYRKTIDVLDAETTGRWIEPVPHTD